METKKGNKVTLFVIILLVLLIIGLGGFIVYDKFIKDDATVEKLDDNDKDKATEEIEYLGTQIKVDDFAYYINGKKHNISFVYSYGEVEEDSDYDYDIYLTLALDGTLLDNTRTKIQLYEGKEIDENKLNLKNIDIVEIFYGADSKEYLAISIIETPVYYIERVNSYIINDEGKILTNINTGFNYALVESTKSLVYENEYYVSKSDGAFYYLDGENIVGEMKTSGGDENVTVQEYKITVKDNVITKTPTETFKATCAGQC